MDSDQTIFSKIQQELETDTEGKGAWLSSLHQKTQSLSSELIKISDSLDSKIQKGLFSSYQAASILLSDLSSDLSLPTIVSGFSKAISYLVDNTLVYVISLSNSKKSLAKS